MSDGHTDVERDKNLEERFSSILRLEDGLVLESDYCANFRTDDAVELIREWADYSRMPRGYNCTPRKEFAYLHIVALGDYIERKIDSGKLWAVLQGKLPDYMRTKKDEDKVKSYIDKWAPNTRP